MLNDSLILDIGIIFLGASVLGLFLKILKQPLILAYILAGILLGPYGLKIIENSQQIKELSQLGVTLLLFLVGLEFSFAKLKQFGSVSLVLGFFQVLISAMLFFLLGNALGFSSLTSFYLALALSFSSTIIVVKILTEKRELDSLYGRLSIGILLVQDILAILALIFIHSFGAEAGGAIGLILFKALLLFVAVLLVSRIILPPIFNQFAASQELLYISSIGWAFGLALIALYLGFSLEIGAFLAGVAIANLPFSLEISSRIKSLHQFFIIIFFTALGLSISFADIRQTWVLAFLLSLFVVFSRFTIIALLSFLHGFKKRTGFLVSSSLSQISEFSLILVAMGVSLNHLDQSIASLVTLVAALTIIFSTYLMEFSDAIYLKTEKFFRFWERRGHFQDDKFSLDEKLSNHIVVFGAGHIVDRVLNVMKKHELDFVVVDFDPTVISRLKEKKINAVYGDMGDPEILEKLNIDEAKIVISTTHDMQDDLRILRQLNVVNKKCFTYMTAFSADHALELYQAGADYVILPNHLSWDVLGEMIGEVKSDNYRHVKKTVLSRRQKHIDDLRKAV